MSIQNTKLHFDNCFGSSPWILEQIKLYQVGECYARTGFETSEHTQRCDEITYIISGEATVMVNGVEYAARAGVGTALTTGRNLDGKQSDKQLDELGRYDRNCNAPDDASATASIREKDDSSGTSKVGMYKANRWGIHDIHGNVHDICIDGYAEYEGDMNSVQTNPPGADPSVSSLIVARGGCWGWYNNNAAARCRLAERRGCEKANDHVVYYRHYGYRLCLEIE